MEKQKQIKERPLIKVFRDFSKKLKNRKVKNREEYIFKFPNGRTEKPLKKDDAYFRVKIFEALYNSENKGKGIE